ncbi:hypothetical protein QJS66_03985 [Kocuria rhizophila]|nr:hypothetical protein QJS66_03985 [Kocuria rhizophila]
MARLLEVIKATTPRQPAGFVVLDRIGAPDHGGPDPAILFACYQEIAD